MKEIHANLLDRLQEAKEQGRLGEFAAIEASLAAAEQKFAAMRDLAARHTTVNLGKPNSVASSRIATPSSETRMRNTSPEHYNEGMTVFLCSKCGTAITPELAELAAIPDVSDDERNRDKETRQAPSTVPRGHYAIDAEPWGPPYVVQDDQEDPKPTQSRGPAVCREEGFVISAGTRHTALLHPDDAAGLQPLPNWENSTGCCGPIGDEGLNRACPCGAPVATLAADCFGPNELHLDPDRTYAFSQ
ncbi:hypothetical protein OHB13_00420 [Streptomyces sp. NBC_00440]|uniref:hypothetical protein n=1 Tax=Streptomyces sp. NBC_00440 TaxID=2975741 RepID=UPI002E2333A1